jgi:hypothetical protein
MNFNVNTERNEKFRTYLLRNVYYLYLHCVCVLRASQYNNNVIWITFSTEIYPYHSLAYDYRIFYY